MNKTAHREMSLGRMPLQEEGALLKETSLEGRRGSL